MLQPQKCHSRDDRKKSWLEKRNVSRAPLCSWAAIISPKWRMNEWIWERGGLACSVEVLLVKTAGKTRERNDVYEGLCTQPIANRVHWKSFDATKYYHRDVTGTAAFPEQLLICFPNNGISCKFLFVNMSCFHFYHRNMTDFQLITHQKVLVLDTELPAGVPLVDVNRELCPVLQWPLLLTETWRDMACMQNTYLFSIWMCTHLYICVCVQVYLDTYILL